MFRPLRLPIGFLTLLPALLGVGCGGDKIHEAIHNPLLVTPAGASAVIMLDIAEARPLPNFESLEKFIRNSDADRSLRGVLPFDYQEFVDHHKLDLFRNIDKLVFSIHQSGWVAVLVGQFSADHLTEIARAERVIEAELPRGTAEAPYTALRERTARVEGNPEWLAALTSLLVSDWNPLGTALVRGVSPSGSLFEAWPSEHIWISSNDQDLFTRALDLYDGQGLDDLLDDAAFNRLLESRPHAALFWLGIPESPLVPSPYKTIEAQLDIRASIIPSIILSFHTEEELTAQYPAVDRLVQRFAESLRAVPEAARDPFEPDPMSAGIIRLGLEDILARAAQTFRAEAVTSANVIEIKIQFPLGDFKRLVAAVANASVR